MVSPSNHEVGQVEASCHALVLRQAQDEGYWRGSVGLPPYRPAPPVWAAFSSSHHQMVGKPLENSGRVSGRLKRFQ